MELIKTIADICIAIFTLALVRATYVLARHTETLNKQDAERKRTQDIQRCIALATALISDIQHAKKHIANFIEQKPQSLLNELLTYGKYFHDADTRRQLENITNSMTLGISDNFTQIASMRDNIIKFEDRLHMAIVDWHKDLGSFGRI